MNGVVGKVGTAALKLVEEERKRELEVKQSMKLMEGHAPANHLKPNHATQTAAQVNVWKLSNQID